MRQNVIKAAPFEAATARQRACMCMCGARKEPSRTGWQREPSAKWKCRRVTYLTTMWHVQRSTDFAAHSRPATPPDSGYIPACVNCDAVPQAAVNWPSPGATKEREREGELAQSIAILCVVRARTESRTRIKYGLYFVCQHMRLERALQLELRVNWHWEPGIAWLPATDT